MKNKYLLLIIIMLMTFPTVVFAVPADKTEETTTATTSYVSDENACSVYCFISDGDYDQCMNDCDTNSQNGIEMINGLCNGVCGDTKSCNRGCSNYIVGHYDECKDTSCLGHLAENYYTRSQNQNSSSSNGGTGKPSSGGSSISDLTRNIGTSNIICDNVKHVTWAYNALRILAPFLLILFGSIDFLKAVMAADEKKQKEARSKFPKRIIAFLLLIILPFVVQFLVSRIGAHGSNNTKLLCCVVTNGNSACEGK